MNRIAMLKFIDSRVGRAVAALLPPPAPSAVPAEVRSILIIRPGGIGDGILLAPAIRQLREQNPSVRITVLAERRNAGVFPLIPAVDEVLCYDRPGELLRVVGSRYDVVIDTEQWHRLSAVIGRLVSSVCKVGFGTNERRRLLTYQVNYSQELYEVNNFLNLFASIGINAAETVRAPFLNVPVSAQIQVTQLLSKFDRRRYVVIFPGATIFQRRWGAVNFADVARIVHNQGVGVVVVGSCEDICQGNKICKDGGINLAGKTTLVETAAVISKSAVLISGDSGILHIGVGLGIPTVSLFGPGITAKWAPRGEKHIVLHKSLPCSPCTKFGYTPRCEIGAKCLQDITVEEVVGAVFDLMLRKSGARKKSD